MYQHSSRTEHTNTEFYKKFKDVFDGLGCISDLIYHINIDPSYQAIIHPPCFVSIKLWPKIQEKLTRMESLDVIEKVNIPTSWVNCTVTIVKPNGTLRIYINPWDLNKAIRREHYPIQTINEVVTRMPDATVSSILDTSSGFWQIKEYQTLHFQHPLFGRYMFKRLPFKLSSS